jgi:predicted dehydrogenase
MQKRKVRWGVLGCGKIARKFAADLRLVADAELVAVAARELSRAGDFAREFPCQFVFGSYDELVRCPEIDVVYIASPHSLHHEHTLLCLRHAKAVLCEKPFAINARQAHEMVQCARQHGVFLMEALWTRFLPHYLKMRELVDSGAVGEVKGVLGNFGFRPQPPVAPRLFDPALGGGALLDIGIYLVFLAVSVLGRPEHIRATMSRAPSGVDEQCSLLFEYADGRQAALFATLAANLETDADIFGSTGRIRMTSRFYEPSSTLQHYQPKNGS